MSRARTAARPDPSGREKAEEWRGMRAGLHEFKVIGEGEDWFVFFEHVTSRRGDEWISCYGGPRGKHPQTAWRSFNPERVRLETVRPSRRGRENDE